MKSANAFSYAISGSFTENQIDRYSDYLNQSTAALQGVGGWLADQAAKTMEQFNVFKNSRAWEMGKRLLGTSDGDYVPRYEIGYLGSISAQQAAQGHMRDIIMCHPMLQQMYIDEEISGYGGDFSAWNTGIGVDNLFYRRMWNGVLHLEVVDDKPKLTHAHYFDTVGGQLSFRERVDSHKTHAAIDHNMAKKMFDVTSEMGDKLKSYVEPTEE
jgi:hypothetical protein